ncbi:cellulose binding domain-containing protein [Streptomyces violascens]|uniref:cellulose binding domain-containing protein n=1 Tax=Streptomyces violascens TaxID=67381 RepID=UPI0037BBB3F4
MSRSSRTSRRRGRTVLTVLLFAVVLAVGATLLYPKWRDAHPGPTELSVRYRTDPEATVTTAKPWVEVINNSKKTVALSDVTLRYYFTADDGAAHGSNCVQTSVGCSNVTQRIGALANSAATADHYLQIGFSAGAGDLKPGDTSQGIGLQLFRLDHKALNQANDHSFNAKDTHYAQTKLVTAYLGGKLVSGDEPSGTAAADKDSAAPAPTAAAPSGVMFDSFRYSGADDPALASNGWQVRSGEGGPGIKDVWSRDGVSFPSEESAQGGQAMRLRVSSDGTKQGTKQSELQSTKPQFFTGTLAARIYFSAKPTSGKGGDHVIQSFFTISPVHTSPKYSELDYEFMPNGGWGAPGPRIDTTSWLKGDGRPESRVTRTQKKQLQGWHTVMITAMNGKVTYSIDGQELFSSGAKYFPREQAGIHFSAWLVDLPFKGQRAWDMKVNWLYYQSGQAVSLPDVQKSVDGFYAGGTPYINTLPKS